MRLTASIILILLSFSVFGQQTYSRADLESRRKQIMEAIQQTQQELDATKKDKRATIGQLRALQNKLAERQRLISNINDEIGEISNNIQSSSKEISNLQLTLEQQKTRYAQSLRYAYETRSSYDMMAFIFSSSNFNDALRRIKYLKKYRDYRKEQVDQIKITQGQIKNKIGVLNTQKNQKGQLLTTQEQQTKTLQQETQETNDVVKDLKGREQELVAEVEKNRKAEARLSKAINEIIRHEIEEERRKAEEERKKAAALAAKNAANNATNNSNDHVKVNNNSGGRVISTTTIVMNNPRKTTTTPEYNLSLTPEAAALSNSFESNRGRLPWPVEKGFISDPFGRHPHPIAEKVMIENNGVDIRTSANAPVRAVFDGTLSRAAYIPGIGWTVIITHGRYFTVYSGLSSVSAQKGQEVHTKQIIGVAGNNDEGEPTINFQIWKDTGKKDPIKMDPATWIAR